MGVPSQLVAERLECTDNPCHQRFAGCGGVELRDDRVDQARDFGKQPSVVAEERSKRLWHREHELPVREIKENLVCQVLGEQQRSLLAA